MAETSRAAAQMRSAPALPAPIPRQQKRKRSDLRPRLDKCGKTHYTKEVRGCSLVVELQLPKLTVRVRFPSSAPCRQDRFICTRRARAGGWSFFMPCCAHRPVFPPSQIIVSFPLYFCDIRTGMEKYPSVLVISGRNSFRFVLYYTKQSKTSSQNYAIQKISEQDGRGAFDRKALNKKSIQERTGVS